MIFFYALLLVGSNAFARPEYSLRQKQNCIECHANPWGGGPRTVYGKVYASRNFTMAKTSESDLYYGDLRGIAYFPTELTKHSSGVALMQASVSANVPVLETDKGSELRTIFTYNAAPLQPGIREAYLRYKTSFNHQFIFGRFNSPFGLLTDEHRTYTKMQSGSTLNQFDTGVSVSGDIKSDFHFDLALVNDLQGSGNFNTGDFVWGNIFNFRWNPSELPFLLGFSQNFGHSVNQPQPIAASLYGILSIESLTHESVPLFLSFETVLAKNWNSSRQNTVLNNFFIPSTATAYQSQIGKSTSQGILLKAKYNFNERYSLFYKYDYLALDRRYWGDSFSRHGLGAEAHLMANLVLDLRYEVSMIGQAQVKDSTALVSQNALTLMLRLWI